MIESLSTPKEWAKISKKFPGRTQHNIKNRFICVVSKELDNKRQKVRDLMKKNTIDGIILKILQNLSLEKQEIMSELKRHQNFISTYDQTMEKKEEFKTIFYEENEVDSLQFEKHEEIFIEQKNFNIDDFINFGF